MTRRRAIALAVTVIVGAACAGDDARDASGSDDAPITSTTGPAKEVVPLVAAAAALHQQCAEAATQLSFTVPCPGLVPVVAGQPAACDEDNCVAGAGGDETLDTIFFFNVSEYDSTEPADVVRHLILEARRVDRAPPVPCYGGTPAGSFRVNGTDVALLNCPESPSEPEKIVHGEGAHRGHLLGFWDQDGVRFVVSIHGGSDDHRALLEPVISAVTLVEPP